MDLADTAMLLDPSRASRGRASPEGRRQGRGRSPRATCPTTSRWSRGLWWRASPLGAPRLLLFYRIDRRRHAVIWEALRTCRDA
jgi:hypothetical protein